MPTPVPFAQRTKPVTTNTGGLSTVQAVTSSCHLAVPNVAKKVVILQKEGQVEISPDPTSLSDGGIHVPIPSPPTMTSPLKPISISVQIYESVGAVLDDLYLLSGGNIAFFANGLGQSESFSIPIAGDSTIPYEIEDGLELILGFRWNDANSRINFSAASVVFST